MALHDFRSLADYLLLLSEFKGKLWLHKEKAILAVILAHSVPRLYESPWLTAQWKLADIFFLANNGDYSTNGFDMSRPYSSTLVSTGNSSDPQVSTSAPPRSNGIPACAHWA